jgi:hypothetical protein
MLLYGTSGSGKTHLAMQANMVQEMAPALLLSGDWGTATARRTDIMTAMLEKPEHLDLVIRGIKTGQLAKFNTVIIDGLSQFYDTIVLGKSSGQVPQIQDWLATSFDAKGYIRDLVRLDKNVIVTCLDQLLQEQSSGTFYTTPLVPGKMAWRLAEAFDIVGHVEVTVRGGKAQRSLRVQPSRRTIAKDRDGTIGREMIDITWELDSGKPPPMAVIWHKWTAYSRGEKPDTEQELPAIEPEDDFLDVYGKEVQTLVEDTLEAAEKFDNKNKGD